MLITYIGIYNVGKLSSSSISSFKCRWRHQHSWQLPQNACAEFSLVYSIFQNILHTKEALHKASIINGSLTIFIFNTFYLLNIQILCLEVLSNQVNWNQLVPLHVPCGILVYGASVLLSLLPSKRKQWGDTSFCLRCAQALRTNLSFTIFSPRLFWLECPAGTQKIPGNIWLYITGAYLHDCV